MKAFIAQLQFECCSAWRVRYSSSEMDRLIALVIFGALCCAVNVESNCDCSHFSDVLRIHNERLSELVNYERHTRLLLEWRTQVMMSIDSNDFYSFSYLTILNYIATNCM